MKSLMLHELHQHLNGRTAELGGMEIIADYGRQFAEHSALRKSAGVLDLSFRGRLCLTGADRVRFLHGQVTNDVKSLRPGEGCYAALVNARGKMESDLNIYCLEDELLLDFEPGLTETVCRRFDRYIVSDDVQVVDVGQLYGMLSVQGPKSAAVLAGLCLSGGLPEHPWRIRRVLDPVLGELYVANQPRLGTAGFEVFAPMASLGAAADKLIEAATALGGGACGWQAFEIARVEAGVPRFGIDMDESNFPLESGIESRAVSYSKGCYVGQEIINRIHTLGHVNRELRGVRLGDMPKTLPAKGAKIFHDGREVGYVTSAVISPSLNACIGLGYVRREVSQAGTELKLQVEDAESIATLVSLPFVA